MFFRKQRLEQQFESEVQYHLDRATQNYIAQGIEPTEARRRARLEFGGVTQIQEELRDVHHARWLADLRQDVAYAARTLRRTPGFLACAVLTLALGIGANTAIFSLIDAVMLRSMAVREPARLVQVARLAPSGELFGVSYPLFEYFRDGLSSISGVFVQTRLRQSMTIDGVEDLVNGDLVSGGYYSSLGLAPAAGRLLGPADENAQVAVISYDYWRRRFALNPAAVGKRAAVGAATFTIVGVEPPGFSGTLNGLAREFVAPLSAIDWISGGIGIWRGTWDNSFFSLMGRLKPGVPLERASAEVGALFDGWQREKAARIATANPRNEFLKERAEALPAAAGLNGLRARFSAPLTALMCIVALVLLLACANLSGLLLARAASRQREISVRRSLGAGNGRLARQFLAESMLLALFGGIAGLALAQWFSRALVVMMANGGNLDLPISPDWRILAFTGAISLFACVAASLAPALNAGKSGVNPGVKQVRSGGRSLGQALVVAQLAISMTLLVGASLFIRTLAKLYNVETGIRTGGVLTFSVRSRTKFPSARALALQTSIVDRLQSLPGVISASASVALPMTGGLWTRAVRVEGYTFHAGEDDTVAFNEVAPQYFAVTGTPLLLGRDFDRHDQASTKPAAIVNESFVRAFFRGQPPLGKHVTSARIEYEVVGVVKDARYEDLRKAAPKTMYISCLQRTGEQPTDFSYLARVADGDPLRLAPAMERTLPQIDPALRLRTPETYDDAVNQTTLNERLMATLGGFFGLLALIVACLGIFGITAFQISRRFNELGVRMALGATRSDIVSLVMREVATLLIPGCTAGCLAAAYLSRFAKSMLFGVTPTDPLAFLLAAGALAIAALAAGFMPALRAARINPMAALRCE